MPSALHHAIPGRVVLTAYSPDGDSLRFLPHSPAARSALSSLPGAAHLRPSTDDTVQLRLQAIDAPETHYRGASQPFALRTRDALLRWLGFTRTAWRAHDAFCTASEPASVTATVLASRIDAHGRVIAHLLRGHLPARSSTTAPLSDADVAAHLLAETASHHLLETGLAYFLAYTSLPPSHALLLRARAAAARAHRRGVWSCDATQSGFRLHDLSSIGPRGELIFPKLFRRCVDYLAAGHTAHEASFRTWLRGHSSEAIADLADLARLDDVVHVAPGAAPLTSSAVPAPALATVRLSDLLQERGRRLSLRVDPLDLVFEEK